MMPKSQTLRRSSKKKKRQINIPVRTPTPNASVDTYMSSHITLIDMRIGRVHSKDESVTGRKTGTRSTSPIKEGTAVFAPPFTLDIGPGLVAIRIRVAVLSAAFHKNMSLSAKVSMG